MPQQQQRESSWLDDARTGFNLATFGADVLNACFQPFTRSGMGTGGLGMAGVGALLLILIYAGLANAPDMLIYWYAWLGMVIYRRITADKSQHTKFHGCVWMFDWCTQHEMTARLLEAAAMPLLGSMIGRFSEPVGLFITFGVFSFGYRYAIDQATVARRRDAGHNARIEMEAMQRQMQPEEGRGW